MAQITNKNNELNNKIIIYENQDGKPHLSVKIENETVWLTQTQMVELFHSSKANVSEHIKHIFEEGELEKSSVVRKFRTTATDDKNYNKDHYNLDLIISLGYRIKSTIATHFRQWATARLKEYIVKGFTLDDERLKISTIKRDLRIFHIMQKSNFEIGNNLNELIYTNFGSFIKGLD